MTRGWSFASACGNLVRIHYLNCLKWISQLLRSSEVPLEVIDHPAGDVNLFVQQSFVSFSGTSFPKGLLEERVYGVYSIGEAGSSEVTS